MISKHRATDACVPEEQLLGELIELQQAIARTLGRRQYVYRVIEEAVHSGHGPTMRAALGEFDRQPLDVRSRVLEQSSRVAQQELAAY